MNKTQYNVLAIFDSELVDDRLQTALSDFKKQITDSGAEITREELWGKRRLAYPINKKEEGIYLDIDFQGGKNVNGRLEEFISTDERVVRFMCIVLPKAKFQEDERRVRVEARERARREAEVARRAEIEARKAAEAARQAALEEVQREAAAAAAAAEVQSASTELVDDFIPPAPRKDKTEFLSEIDLGEDLGLDAGGEPDEYMDDLVVDEDDIDNDEIVDDEQQ